MFSMKLKTAFYIFGTFLLLTFVSCLGDKDDPEIILSPDAQILSFSIKNDSVVKGLTAIKFSIDQVNGEIYNTDSATFGLKLPDKVAVSYSTANGGNILNITNIANGDSVWINSGDTIDLTKPLRIRSFAATGHTKEYDVRFNMHKVDPDSIWWKQVDKNLGFSPKTIIINDTLYSFAYRASPTTGYIFFNVWISSDWGVSWEPIPIYSVLYYPNLHQMQQYGNKLFVCTSSGDLYKANLNDNFTSWTQVPSDYQVRNIFGTLFLDVKNGKLDVNGKKVLVLAVEKEGEKYFAIYDGNSISDTQYKVPADFPTEAFSSIAHARVNVGRLTVAGGNKGAVWETMDGLRWAQLGVLPSQVQGANVFLYDDKFYLLNGKTADGYNTSVYTSKDQGLTWQLAPSKTYLPKNTYKFREDASLVVASDNMIYIMGGMNEVPITDIWKGRLNRLNQ